MEKHIANENATVIALAGNPNSGKTSVFNFITGSRQRVGNYPGVTVERKEGTVNVDGASVTFVDLPGTYSLSPYSPEEHIAMREIISERISGIIVVVDTSRLSRNLYLVSQILETGKQVVIALNMYDEFEAPGNVLDVDLWLNLYLYINLFKAFYDLFDGFFYFIHASCTCADHFS